MAHILVIEDNTTMREGIVQILESMHLDVYGASNGKEGLEYFHMTQPDLVITDLKMEEIDGMQVLQEIKKHTQNTLVLMITAFGTIELAVEAMQLGAFDFITKPFPPNMLRVKVNKALDVLQTKAENSYLRQQQMKKTSMMLIGKSEAMHKVQQQIKKVASLDDPI
ncbi:MAG: sigma-54-dependent Fis family transcriptional regulator, partial [Deltaproteobacteria bacterium]|nr:sigma-54-dependent Fis family transcriptional regulator [Deltaproteobacteria bacterium]